jgi:hypothetical protein
MHLLTNVVLENPRLFQDGKFLNEIEQDITKNQSWNVSDYNILVFLVFYCIIINTIK